MRPARALAVLAALNCLNIYDRQVLGALAEPVRREFGLSDMQLGALATAFIVVYAVAGLPLGRLADTAPRRKLLAAGVLAWTSLTALGGFAVSYAMLLASRIGVAIGEAVCAPAAASWIGDLFPPERRSRALAVFMLGVPIGIALSYAVGGPAAQAWGWRAAMLLAAAPALLLVPALLVQTEPQRATRPAAAAITVSSLLAVPAFRWIVLSGAVVNFNLYAFSTFFPAFLARYHGLTIAQSGFWAGIGTGVTGIAGGLLAGFWGDRVLRRKGGRLRAAALAALCAAPASLAGVSAPAGAAAPAIVLLMLAYGLLSMYYGLVYAAIQDIVGPSARGTAMALYFLAMYLCGAAFGPLLTGRLSDLLAHRASPVLTEAARATGLHQAMYTMPLLALILAAVLWSGSRSKHF